jgi:hypothetical protein
MPSLTPVVINVPAQWQLNQISLKARKEGPA